MSTWLDRVLEYAQDSESPRAYFQWAGLAALSGVVRNKVYLDKFYYKLYPNLYVLLIGKSGIRKGIPVALAKSLVEGVKCTRIISGRTSIQKVISELSIAYTVNGGPPIMDSVGYLSSSEFASFIIQDPQALTILTDLYDGHYHPEWTNFTKVSGAETLKNVCLTLLGASNEVHFKEAVPDNALGGGFIARTVIVYADKKATINPLTERPRQTIEIGTLIEYLHKVSNLEGEFTWSTPGKLLYDQWYHQYSEGTLAHDDTGTFERIHDTILKVAMLISVSRKLDLVIEEVDIQDAIEYARLVIPGVRRISMGSGSNPLGTQTATVLKELISCPPHYTMSKSKMLSRYWGHFDAYDLDRIAESLQQQRAIKIAMKNGETYYILDKKVVENFHKLQ